MVQRTKFIYEEKELIENYEQEKIVDVKKLYYPLINLRTKSYELFVKEGDYVRIGDIIGCRDGVFFKQNIHATVSGTVLGIEKKFHRGGRKYDCIVVENDFKEEFSNRLTNLTEEEIASLSKEELIEKIADNSVVGLGGSGFPTAVKLETEFEIDHVILNAVECEPYMMSDYIALIKHSEEIIKGLSLIMRIYSASNGYVAIKSKNEMAIEAMEKAVENLEINNIEIKAVGNYYPQGYEKDVIKSTLNKTISVTDLPAKYGIMVFNSTTAKSVYDAVRYNTPVLERDFLISGFGVEKPRLLLVKVGTIVSDIMGMVEGYSKDIKEKDYVLIAGGPMMGSSVASDDLVVTKTLTTILIMPKVEEKEMPCVKCSSCVLSCPSKLSPVSLMNAVKTKNIDALNSLNMQNCTGCGMCSYVCTSKIHLTEYMRKGKKML